MSFEGFSAEALKFLFENKLNNSKEWYDGHKGIYKKYVYEPFVELIKELAPVATEIDSKIITVPSRLISRVRRDTRFSRDKTLYRDNVWFVFLRDKSQMSTSPCFWFELSQKGSSYGVGYYGAETHAMARMRELILDKNPVFINALKCYESQNQFIIGGDLFKRSKYPDQPDNLKTWLDRKNVYFESVQNDYNLAFSKDLPQALANAFRLLKPIYDFLLLVEQ